jgi:hypothetical protein
MACLAKGLGMRATARVVEVDPNTVLRWLGEAAEQLRAFLQYFRHALRLNQVQLDELYAVLSAVKDGELSEDEAIERLSRSLHWVWMAIDPETKWRLVIDVGTRTLAMAQRVLHQVAQGLAPGCIPCFSAMASRITCRPTWLILASRFNPSGAKIKAPCPSPVGCRCSGCSMHQ